MQSAIFFRCWRARCPWCLGRRALGALYPHIAHLICYVTSDEASRGHEPSRDGIRVVIPHTSVCSVSSKKKQLQHTKYEAYLECIG